LPARRVPSLPMLERLIANCKTERGVCQRIRCNCSVANGGACEHRYCCFPVSVEKRQIEQVWYVFCRYMRIVARLLTASMRQALCLQRLAVRVLKPTCARLDPSQRCSLRGEGSTPVARQVPCSFACTGWCLRLAWWSYIVPFEDTVSYKPRSFFAGHLWWTLLPSLEAGRASFAGNAEVQPRVRCDQ